MKKNLLPCFRLFAVLTFTFVFARPVFAHGNVPRLEISAERFNPGDTLQLRGVDFEYDQEVAVELVNAVTHILVVSMGNAATDVEGVFVQNIILPPDLPEGSYAMRAVAYDHETFSPPFTVWGIPVQNEESNVIRDQSDVQLEPVTPLPPGLGLTSVSSVSSSPVASPEAQGLPSATSSNPNRNLIIISLLLITGILFIFGIKILHKR